MGTSIEIERLHLINGVERLDAYAARGVLPHFERAMIKAPLAISSSTAFLDDDGWIWGSGEPMQAICRTIDRIADSDVSVVIGGESGVGKGIVAKALHYRSHRRAAPFVKVNCAALPADLFESELFGFERGAFTGAATARAGKFEQAEGGTLLLDEIGDMLPPLQAKLLHVLQDGEFAKLGSNKSIRVDVRVLASTNRNLEAMRNSGDFREDLYYRLGVVELRIPPLRERREEIPVLTDFFLAQCSRKYKRPLRLLSPDMRQMFQEYDWPGNIRELDNLIRRVVVLQDEQPVRQELERHLRGASVPITVADTQAPEAPNVDTPSTSRGRSPALEAGPLLPVAKAAARETERVAIAQTLHSVHWNRRKAAQILGVSYKTLLNKIKECGIQ